MTVCICTAFDTGFASLAEITLPILVKYCEKHSYALKTEMNPNGDIYWKRTEMLLDTLPHFDVAVWMDTDALVTNHTKRIEWFLPEGKNLCVSSDKNGINDGVLIVNRGSEPLLHSLLRLRGGPGIHAPQDALQLLKSAPNIRVVPNKLFNAFPVECEGDAWEPGDMILQMPGINRERRLAIASAAIPQIVW